MVHLETTEQVQESKKISRQCLTTTWCLSKKGHNLQNEHFETSSLYN